MSSWVLVTGGAVRLGREISLSFAHAGWNVACHCLESVAAAQSLCAQIKDLGRDSLVVQAQLTDEADCRRLWNEVTQHTGQQLHCVVNNASLFLPDRGTDFDESHAMSQLQANLLAPMRLGKWMAQLHADSKSIDANVIHVLDQKVFNLNPDYFSYTLSKLALERAVSLQAQSLAPRVRINAVAPGLMYLSGPQSADNFARASRANLLRKPISPANVAQSVLFLANNNSITGTCIRVDNGQHLIPMERDVMFVVDEVFKDMQ